MCFADYPSIGCGLRLPADDDEELAKSTGILKYLSIEKKRYIIFVEKLQKMQFSFGQSIIFPGIPTASRIKERSKLRRRILTSTFDTAKNL